MSVPLKFLCSTINFLRGEFSRCFIGKAILARGRSRELLPNISRFPYQNSRRSPEKTLRCHRRSRVFFLFKTPGGRMRRILLGDLMVLVIPNLKGVTPFLTSPVALLHCCICSLFKQIAGVNFCAVGQHA